MNDTLTVHIEGIGWCSPGLAGWSAARDLLRQGVMPPATGSAKSTPALLHANERRRAPEIVQLACDVAGEVSRERRGGRRIRYTGGRLEYHDDALPTLEWPFPSPLGPQRVLG